MILAGYTDLPTLKAAANVADDTSDALLEAIITAASRAIDDYCGRRFYTAVETRTYATDNPLRLLLPEDLVSVTSLKTDIDRDRVYETVWAATDYDLLPANNPVDQVTPLPYWEIAVSPLGINYFPIHQERAIQVVGAFGCAFPIVVGGPALAPAVVRQACLLQGQLDWQAQLASGHGTAGGGVFGQPLPQPGAGLHPFVRRMLDPYRVLTHGGPGSAVGIGVAAYGGRGW
jgi:Phage gp6-like head-tail connector protein